MRLRVRAVFIFLSVVFTANANPIDSLQLLLQSVQSDSKKAEVFRALSYEYLKVQELESCYKYAQLGLELSKKSGNRRAEARNLEMLGNFYYYKGLSEKAMDIFSSILVIAENTDDKDLLARSYSMMGWIYVEQRRFDGAIDVFSKALTFLTAGYGHNEYLALTYYGMASVYSYRHSSLRNLSLAKLFYDSALRVKLGLQNRERAFALTELGAAFRDGQNDFTKSLKYFSQAESILTNDSNHIDTRAYLFAEMGFTFIKMNNTHKARHYANQSLQLYHGLPLYTRIPSVYELLAETYEQMGDFKMAFKMENLNRALSDSLFNRRNILLVEQIRAQYDDSKKKEQIEQLSEANMLTKVEALNNRNVAIVVGASSVTIFILISLIYFNRNRYQKKIQKLKLQQTLREERDRIARDLHDSLGGQLSSISIGLNSFANHNKGTLQSIQGMADKALSELRNSLWTMDKESISIGEIEQRINDLFWQYRKMEIPINLHITTQENLRGHQLSSSEAGNLYRIIQEATHNSVKHSQAKEFRVNMEKVNHSINVSIVDNGIGMQAGTLLGGEHYGLRNMKVRAEQMKASLTVISKPSEGTKIDLKISIP